jgi:hypothetical protein
MSQMESNSTEIADTTAATVTGTVTGTGSSSSSTSSISSSSTSSANSKKFITGLERIVNVAEKINLDKFEKVTNTKEGNL